MRLSSHELGSPRGHIRQQRQRGVVRDSIDLFESLHTDLGTDEGSFLRRTEGEIDLRGEEERDEQERDEEELHEEELHEEERDEEERDEEEHDEEDMLRNTSTVNSLGAAATCLRPI